MTPEDANYTEVDSAPTGSLHFEPLPSPKAFVVGAETVKVGGMGPSTKPLKGSKALMSVFFG
ncbi:hypothetical protein FQN53_008576 [Emmonsiellopsis sp. PD_33]|nr:hypothetical protein FQN53_008576 [Emmonsiellopsis sp. PD_33]